MKSNRILTIVIVLLVVALAVSIAANYFLFKQGEAYYNQLNLTRLDPLGLSVYPPQKYEEAEKTRVVFFGDSRAYQWPEPSGLDQFEFVNRGIGAQTSTQAVERFDEHVVPLHPDIVLIQMGINDLKTIPLFPHLKSWIVTNCKNNIKWSVEETRNQGSIVILTTIFPLGELPIERSLFWSDDVGEAIEEVNKYIYSLEGDGVVVFDTGQVLAGEDGLVREEYSWDFLHLNEVGYEVLDRELVTILEKLE